MNHNSYLIEIFSDSNLPVLFIDFDGTISKRDVIDAILEEFADEQWLEIEEKWVKGEIGSRECLQKQFALVRATPDELNEFLDTLTLDEGFLPLFNFCRETGIAVHIASDGFEYYIRRMLEKHLLPQQLNEEISIWANGLIPAGDKIWRTQFPYFEKTCVDGCATCKPEVMKRNNFTAAPTIFIGDGLSDRFAARTADIVFAKKKLSEYCLQNHIPQTTYINLLQVAESLDQAFESFTLTLPDQRRSWLKVA